MTLIVREIPWVEPCDAAARLQHETPLALLDSGGPIGERSRYSYLAWEPFARLTVHGRRVELDGRHVGDDIFAALSDRLQAWRLDATAAPVPFIGGAIGYFGYGLASHLDGPPLRHQSPDGLPDAVILFFDVIVAFDRQEQRAYVISSGLPVEGLARATRAQERANAVSEALGQKIPSLPSGERCESNLSDREADHAEWHERDSEGPAQREGEVGLSARTEISPPHPDPLPLKGAEREKLLWRELVPRGGYEAQVQKVIEHIRAGDIYQANFTAPFHAQRPPAMRPFAAYRHLRWRSPAPFGAFLSWEPGLALASASPERFLRLSRTGAIESRPIKGTRPRGTSPNEDEALKAELLASAKDCAENLMIVDLLRNDIGRVAEIGSVAVPRLFELESFAQVHHLVSSVTGCLRAGLGPADLLRVTLPGGSITGAPKRRAMEIIDQMEVTGRGAYCGALAWIGFDGAMDSSILIRTLTITRKRLIAQAGGGIVADSDPAAEYDEMRVKVAPLLLDEA